MSEYVQNTIAKISKEDTSAMKGFFAVCVLAHHLYQNTGLFRGTVVGMGLLALGYLSTSVFFFLSGYGLMISYLSKGQLYLHSFFRNKIMPFYIQNVMLILLYCGYLLLSGHSMTIGSLVSSFFFGGTVIIFGWYLQAILLLYLLFFVIFRFLKKPVFQWLGFAAGYGAYYCLCFLLDLPANWYESILAFGTGMVYAKASQHSRYGTGRKKMTNILLTLPFFGLTFVLGNTSIIGSIGCWSRTILKICSSVAFALLVAFIKQQIPCGFKLFEKLHIISFEIYVSQGLFINLFHSSILYVENRYLYILFVSGSVLLFSIVLHCVFDLIKRLLKSNQHHSD